MTYGATYNKLLKDNTELTNDQKIELIESLETKDLLTIIRNFEESPREYDKLIIEKVIDKLCDKGIYCMW